MQIALLGSSQPHSALRWSQNAPRKDAKKYKIETLLVATSKIIFIQII